MIVTAVLMVYFVGWIWFFFTDPEIPIIAKILGTMIPLALAGVSITVLVQRILEIRKEDDDDLSKY